MQTLIITGASRGLGAHMARRAAEEGFEVIGLSRTGAAPEGVQGMVCDVADEKNILNVCAALTDKKNIYGLINAAGIAAMNLVVMTPPETVRKIIDTNLVGSILCASLIGKLIARNKNGRIINFSTLAVPLAVKGEAIYAASKAGVEGFSRAYAREMADLNVTVNCIAPGPIDTDLIRNVPQQNITELVNRQLNPKQAVPEDVWNIASLILKPESNMITGQVFHVGGA